MGNGNDYWKKFWPVLRKFFGFLLIDDSGGNWRFSARKVLGWTLIIVFLVILAGDSSHDISKYWQVLVAGGGLIGLTIKPLK